jgi:hypothetical protein
MNGEGFAFFRWHYLMHQRSPMTYVYDELQPLWWRRKWNSGRR